MLIKNGYAGWKDGIERVVVRVRDGIRTPLKHEVSHSPAGMNWGYGGSGPADLALSILTDFLGDREKASRYYQDFKWKFVTHFGDEWELSDEEIKAWLATQAK